jgi:hypothetical protein
MKIAKRVSETLALLTLLYGEYTTNKSDVFEWHRQFKEGQEDAQDGPRSGQPKTRRIDGSEDRVRTLVLSDRRLGVRLTAVEG